jgi:chorismate mutase
VPKFFLAFQVARIKTAQGITITDPGQTVEHLLEKVTKNAAGENQALLNQVVALSTQLR